MEEVDDSPVVACGQTSSGFRVVDVDPRVALRAVRQEHSSVGSQEQARRIEVRVGAVRRPMHLSKTFAVVQEKTRGPGSFVHHRPTPRYVGDTTVETIVAPAAGNPMEHSIEREERAPADPIDQLVAAPCERSNGALDGERVT